MTNYFAQKLLLDTYKPIIADETELIKDIVIIILEYIFSTEYSGLYNSCGIYTLMTNEYDKITICHDSYMYISSVYNIKIFTYGRINTIDVVSTTENKRLTMKIEPYLSNNDYEIIRPLHISDPSPEDLEKFNTQFIIIHKKTKEVICNTVGSEVYLFNIWLMLNKEIQKYRTLH